MTYKKSSGDQSQADVPSESLANLKESFPPNRATRAESEIPGSFNDDAVVRSVITDGIRKSPKSREAIADEMSALTGERITVRMLNSYTSVAAEQHRFPAQYVRAFCHSIDDWTLLRCIAERGNFSLIAGPEADLMELGRQYLRQKRAAEQAAELEKRLAGVQL